MKSISIPEDEYRWLHALYLAALPVRRQGVQQFNRFPPAMRLAMTSLVAHYEERGLDERGLPPGTAIATRVCGACGKPEDDHDVRHPFVSALAPTVSAEDALARPCSVCNAKPGEKCSGVVNANRTLEVPHFSRRSA